jgi:hypothetical protein
MQSHLKSAAKFLYRSIFLITTVGIAFYQSNLSKGREQGATLPLPYTHMHTHILCR